MTTSDQQHHGHSRPDEKVRDTPRPSYAERALTLMVRAGEGTLATLSRRHPGFPFASLMPYALDASGRPLVLISDLAVHTRNLEEDPRASLLVTEPEAGDRDPLGLARITLMGRIDRVPDGSLEVSRERYLARHGNARHWIDYPDFSLRRIEVEEAYWVGGFGVMGWVSAEELRHAEPDPLLDAAGEILRHVNEDHPDALLALARSRGLDDAVEARMTGVDRLGYDLRVRTAEGVRGLRIPFPEEVRTAGQVRNALVEQTREAREA